MTEREKLDQFLGRIAGMTSAVDVTQEARRASFSCKANMLQAKAWGILPKSYRVFDPNMPLPAPVRRVRFAR